VNTPLVRDGTWPLTLSVTSVELELMGELTTCIWDQIERECAEAAAAVHASQEQFSTVASFVPDLLWES